MKGGRLMGKSVTLEEALKRIADDFLTANLNNKSRYNPHVFTEQGLYMLMTVLKGPLAVKQSKVM